MTAPLAHVGILSIGDMGLGIAKLLVANNYRVITNVTGRSEATHTRARSASLQLASSDEELAAKSDYILSIVPPRDSLSTAQRILDASSKPSFKDRKAPLYFLDLNAVSPRSAREVAELLRPAAGQIHFIDGGIIGGPPKLKDANGPSDTPDAWNRPSIPVSGPHALADAEPSGAHLADLLKINHISKEIGPASGLKMSFAALTKGLTALAIQSFTTAQHLNVLPELQEYLQRHSPKTLELTQRGIVNMPPKAYRWVKEMEEIGKTFAEDGGFDEAEGIFPGISKTYELVAYGTQLGEEKTEQRVNGKTPESVAELMNKGIEQRKIKKE